MTALNEPETLRCPRGLLFVGVLNTLFFLSGGCKEKGTDTSGKEHESKKELRAEMSTSGEVHVSRGSDNKETVMFSEAEVRAWHKDLTQHEFPDYAQYIEGSGKKVRDNREARSRACYTFVVPEEHRKDFDQYLLELGVPEKFLYDEGPKDISPYLAREQRDVMVKSDPPQGQLLFVQSYTFKTDIVNDGYLFSKHQAMGYVFDNPDLVNTTFSISFSRENGCAYILDTKIKYER